MLAESCVAAAGFRIQRRELRCLILPLPGCDADV